jgi:hypothetical protein
VFGWLSTGGGEREGDAWLVEIAPLATPTGSQPTF